MSKFIRIDNVGEWKGTEHKSFLGSINDESYEGGISCYELEEGCIELLYDYWKNDVWNTDSTNRQITIFEGEKIGCGSSFEDLATCTRTVLELPASMLFDRINFFEDVENGYEYYNKDEEEEISLEDEIFNGMDKFEIVEKAILRCLEYTE